MGPGEGIAGVLKDIFVEFSVLRLSNFCLVFEPEGFVFVESFKLIVPGLFGGGSVDCVFNVVVSEIFSFGLPLFFQCFMFIGELLIRFLNFFFIEIFFPQINWVVDEGAVLLDEFFELFIRAVLSGVLLKMEPDQSASF
jgi:hypothetical protein